MLGGMTTQAPTTKEAFERRFHENQKIEGFGLDGTTTRMPCPFCAAPDFVVYKILEVTEALAAESVCKECGRGAKALVTKAGSSVSYEVVQTRGDDPPPFVLKLRRV
jgi:hypothetical protein